jgi:hypothetical protein
MRQKAPPPFPAQFGLLRDFHRGTSAATCRAPLYDEAEGFEQVPDLV